MRWVSGLVVVGVVVVLGVAAPAPARAESPCRPDPLQATCVVLDDCGVIGALYMTQPPLDALAFYRTCLFTDHDYGLTHAGGSGSVAEPRSPRPEIYGSTFWPLYCDAVRRAGRRDPSICERRVRASRTRTHRSVRHRAHHRRTPRFTG